MDQKIPQPVRRSLDAFFPVVLLVSGLIFFAPFTIYTGNLTEFATSFLSLCRYFGPVFIILVTLLLVASFPLPDGVFQRFITLVFTLAVLLWLQGTVLVIGGYGAFDGGGISWDEHQWRLWYEVPLWVIVPAFAVYFHRPCLSIVQFGSKLLLVLQALHLLMQAVSIPEETAAKGVTAPPRDTYALSSADNTIHVVLDAFQSDVFSEIISEYPDIANQLDGFVFFRNAAGVFPYTRLSVPAMLSGKTHDHRTPVKEFLRNSLSGNTVTRAFTDNGHVADLVTFRQFCTAATTCYNVPRPYRTGHEYDVHAAVELLDLAIFRLSPHFVKRALFDEQGWSLRRLPWLRDRRQYAAVSSLAFLKEYVAKVYLADSTPRYKFLHLQMPHSPIVLGADCEFVGKQDQTRSAFKAQATCALRTTIGFLQRLKDLGVYDTSLIIVSSDHGNDFPSARVESQHDRPEVVSRSQVLLLAKKPHSKDRLRVSSAPVSLADIPATIASEHSFMPQFTGWSVFEVPENAQRIRTFYYTRGSQTMWGLDYYPQIDRYAIDGEITSPKSWIYQGRILPPGTDDVASDPGAYQWGTQLTFGVEGTFVPYAWWGWSYAEPRHTWTLGKSAVLRLPFEGPAVDLRLDVKVRAAIHTKQPHQRLTIVANGTLVSTHIVDWIRSRQLPPVLIPRGTVARNPNVLEIMFRVPDCFRPRDVRTSRDARCLSLAFSSMVIERMDPIPTYQWGTQLTFGVGGNFVPYAWGGWSLAESSHSWTLGKSAVLRFPLEGPAIDLHLRARLRAAIHTKQPYQRLTIMANGTLISTHIVDWTKGRELPPVLIPQDTVALNPHMLEIIFGVPDCFRLKDVRSSRDARCLSLAFSSMIIDRADALLADDINMPLHVGAGGTSGTFQGAGSSVSLALSFTHNL